MGHGHDVRLRTLLSCTYFVVLISGKAEKKQKPQTTQTSPSSLPVDGTTTVRTLPPLSDVSIATTRTACYWHCHFPRRGTHATTRLS